MYNFEDQSKLLFTLDFPASFTLADLCTIIKEKMNYSSSDCISIFDRYSDKDLATCTRISDSLFTFRMYNNTFPGSKIYFFYTPGITNFSNKSVYIVQVAPDGYNITFNKPIVVPTQTNPAQVLIEASKCKGFPEVFIPQIVREIAEMKLVKPEQATPDKTNFMIYDVHMN